MLLGSFLLWEEEVCVGKCLSLVVVGGRSGLWVLMFFGFVIKKGKSIEIKIKGSK